MNMGRSWSMEEICKTKEEKSFVNKLESKSLKAEDYTPSGVTASALKSSAAASSSTLLPPSPPDTDSTEGAGPVSKASALSNQPIKGATPTPQAPVSSAVSAAAIGPKAPAVSVDKDRLAVMSYNDFAVENESILERYSEIASLEDTKEYLFKNCNVLLHEHAQNYLLLSCLEDEMNKKHKRMKLVCRQSQIISHIIELAQSMARDPREVVLPFFKRIEEKVHLDGFLSAVNDFTERIKKRAVEKRREMDAEEAEERRAHSANGMDPMEVLQSLPVPLREAFESQVLF